MAKTAKTVKYPIGFKMMFIITGLLALSLGAITLLVSSLISMDVQVTAESSNFSANAQAAAVAENYLTTIRSESHMLLRTLGAIPARDWQEMEEFFFTESTNMAAVVVGGRTLVNDDFFLNHEADPEGIHAFLASHEAYLERAAAGETLVLNGTPVFEIPLLVMMLPSAGASSAVAVFFSSDALAQSFGGDVNNSFLINSEADVLVHPNHDLVREGANFADRSFIKAMREQGNLSIQTLYTDDDGVRYFGAFTRIPLADTAVITNVEYNVVFEGVTATIWRNIWLSVGVLFISILCVWFFSKTISNPLKKLSSAAGKIKEGQFNIDISSKTRDEIGLLTNSFVEMSQGLAERERLKDTFGKFINKEIAERAMKGELELGGESKLATIFFSDIRNFTSIAEKMPAQDVVGFLNSYLLRMVNCVTKTGGVVDKFIGDAIMAIWGVPVSSGNPARDALSCVRSALMMRVALQDYNTTRGTADRPHLTIGCGINSGDVVAGQIGSKERMEYTVIGDAVNLASRTESLNKALNTDILITENTWNLVQEYIISEEMPSVTVKGKEKPIRLFAVINLRVNKPGKEQPAPRTLAELRGILNLAAPNLAEVNLNEEEKKYKFQND
jgi:adenylate cyclase